MRTFEDYNNYFYEEGLSRDCEVLLQGEIQMFDLLNMPTVDLDSTIFDLDVEDEVQEIFENLEELEDLEF